MDSEVIPNRIIGVDCREVSTRGMITILSKTRVTEKVHTLICLGKDNKKLTDFFTPIVKEVKETQSVKDLVRMDIEVCQRRRRRVVVACMCKASTCLRTTKTVATSFARLYKNSKKKQDNEEAERVGR